MGPFSFAFDVWYRAWRYRLRVERGSVRLVRRMVQPGQTVVDIGAHKGAYTFWLQRAVGPQGSVIAFEPQPELAQYLESVKSALRWRNVRLVNAAVSDHSGTVTIQRTTSRPSPGARVGDGAAIEGGDSFAVPAVSLDDFFHGRAARPVHFIKCDAEGHESEIFRGARGLLEQDHPTLLFECERRHRGGAPITPVFEFLHAIGYEGHFVRGNDLEELDRFQESDQDDPESPDYVNNFVFTPAAARDGVRIRSRTHRPAWGTIRVTSGNERG